MTLAGQVLILTGPPGSGKTTAAAALAKCSDSPAVHVHADDFWNCIKQGAIPPYLPQSQRQNEVVVRALVAAVRAYAEGGYFVVVDGIIGPWFLEPFRSGLACSPHYVVLQVHADTCVARAKARGNGQLAASGPIRDLHRQLLALGHLQNHAVDVNGLNPAAVQRTVLAALRADQYRLRSTGPSE